MGGLPEPPPPWNGGVRNWNLLSPPDPPCPPQEPRSCPHACWWPPRLHLTGWGWLLPPCTPCCDPGTYPCLSLLSLWPDWKQKMTKSVFFLMKCYCWRSPRQSLVVAMVGLGVLRQRPLLASALPLLPLVVGQAGRLPESKLPYLLRGFSSPTLPSAQARGLTWWCWAPHPASARTPCGGCSSSDQTPGLGRMKLGLT